MKPLVGRPGVVLFKAKPQELPVREIGLRIVPDVAGIVLVGSVVLVKLFEIVESVER